MGKKMLRGVQYLDSCLFTCIHILCKCIYTYIYNIYNIYIYNIYILSVYAYIYSNIYCSSESLARFAWSHASNLCSSHSRFCLNPWERDGKIMWLKPTPYILFAKVLRWNSLPKSPWHVQYHDHIELVLQDLLSAWEGAGKFGGLGPQL